MWSLLLNTCLEIKTFTNQNIKFNYLIGPNILQLVFDFITYSIGA